MDVRKLPDAPEAQITKQEMGKDTGNERNPLRREVLDNFGYVELVDWMGDDNSVVDAARVSYQRSANEFTEEHNNKLLSYLIKHKHGTPFEMVTFKFRVNAPVMVWWHWVRHRIASYNFQSGRYTEFEDIWYLPSAFREQDTKNKQGSVEMEMTEEHKRARAILSVHYTTSMNLYKSLIDMGVAREQARLALPGFAMYYTALVSMNFRSLLNFLTLRTDSHAQWETQQYAWTLQELVERTHPNLISMFKEHKILHDRPVEG